MIAKSIRWGLIGLFASLAFGGNPLIVVAITVAASIIGAM